MLFECDQWKVERVSPVIAANFDAFLSVMPMHNTVMEEKQRETGTGSLVFAINGLRFEVSSVSPSTTLLEFLRAQTPFKSPKLGCGEGIIALSFAGTTHNCTFAYHN